MTFVLWLLLWELIMSPSAQGMIPQGSFYAMVLIALALCGAGMAVAAFNDSRGIGQMAYLHTAGLLIGMLIYIASIGRYILSIPLTTWSAPVVLHDMMSFAMVVVVPAILVMYPCLTIGMTAWARFRGSDL